MTSSKPSATARSPEAMAYINEIRSGCVTTRQSTSRYFASVTETDGTVVLTSLSVVAAPECPDTRRRRRRTPVRPWYSSAGSALGFGRQTSAMHLSDPLAFARTYVCIRDAGG